MFERLAAMKADGRYRFGARKLPNYIHHQNSDSSQRLDSADSWLIALAALWTDECVHHLEPAPGTLWNQHLSCCSFLCRGDGIDPR